jgi:hypothetical protein
MSISKLYKTLSIYTYSEGDFETPAGYGDTPTRTFKGLIQAPSPSNTFNNAKDTLIVNAVLFCSHKEVFTSTDIIDNDGVKYKIANSETQKDGVCGLTPKKSQHAEYNLTYYQGAL